MLDQILRRFYNRSLLTMHVCAFVGFVGGMKLCDYIFFDNKPYEELREDMEDEFWLHYGEPKHLQPYIVPSIKNPEENRKSWIYIMYEKDQYIKKKDQFD